MSSRNEYDLSYEKKTVVWLQIMYNIKATEVFTREKSPCSCSPKPSRVVNIIIVLHSFFIKHQ